MLSVGLKFRKAGSLVHPSKSAFLSNDIARDYNKTARHDYLGCLPKWTIHRDTNGQGGVSASAETVEECRTECARNSSCTAIDWNTAASAGQHCWLHGSWSRGSTVHRTGIHHHVIARTCGEPHFTRTICLTLIRPPERFVDRVSYHFGETRFDEMGWD